MQPESCRLARRAFMLGLLTAALVGVCMGDTITLASNAAETTNNSARPTMAVAMPDPLWNHALAGSSWVSNTNSSDPFLTSFVLVPNGTSVAFSDTFTVNGTPTSGTLMVMADDTSDVILNGNVVFAKASSVGNTYQVCSDYAIGCLPQTLGTLDLAKYLKSGVNTLTFNVTQVDARSFGLDYLATINSTGIATPEPAALLLVGLPLVVFALVRRKRA